MTRNKGDITMLRWFAFTLLAGILSISFSPVHATDEQRQAYDKMVEESVKEADDDVDQKQQQAAEKQARQQQEAQQRAQEAADKEKASQEKTTSRGVHVRKPPSASGPDVEAVPLPSGVDSVGSGEPGAAVLPAGPPAD
jgi:transcription initiation factor TFIID subunit TAF12